MAGGSDREPVLIALGSNIEPRRNLPAAVRLLAERCRLVGVSRVWETEPVGASSAPTFLNAAARIETGLEPRAVKYELLRPIEERLGRVRGADRDAPRTIDLDLAIFGSRVIDDRRQGLRLPDPEIVRRAHLALPLADLAADFEHPVTGRTLGDIAGDFAAVAGVWLLADVDLRAAIEDRR